MGASRRRYGGYVAHIGVLLVALGVTASSTFRSEREATLRPLKEMDWRTLMAVSSGKMDSKTSIAMAFRDLAENAQKIGQLNISPDLLEMLLAREGVDGAPEQSQGRGRKQ